MKRPENLLRDCLILLLLIAVGISSRFVLFDLPNFKPIASIVLFAAFWFRSYLVAGLALVLMMLVSNSALDHCPWQVTLGVIGGLIVAGLLGRRLHAKVGNAESVSKQPVAAVGQILGSAFAMSAAFFLISNFAVWSMGQWYPMTAEGFVSCFAAAVPFFKYTLFGDLFFSAGIFAVWFAIEFAIEKRTQLLPAN